MTYIKIPKTLGACADKLYDLRQQRKVVEAQVDEIKAQEHAIENHLIDSLPKSDASGVSGKTAKVNITTNSIPTVKDWDALYKHILKTKDFTLLQRRVGEAAVKERWEAGKTVPGVETFNVIKASVTKL